MALNIAFSPLIPLPLLLAFGAGILLLALVGLVVRARGVALRALALSMLLFALAGPSLNRESREPLDDVVVIAVDRSQSQGSDARTRATDEALALIKQRLDVEGVDLRIVEANAAADEDGTHLFSKLTDELRDTPAERISGVVLLTDGQVHDIPEDPAALGLEAPIHTLITGVPDEADRKLTIVEAPRFGIVGQTLSFSVRVDDLGKAPPGTPPATTARLTVRVDGGAPRYYPAPVGREQAIAIEIEHSGENVIEVEVNEGPAELTLQNNRAVLVANGVRDRLRVLLVSGEPHAGERTWRNLLKADPSVELVHFTILRPRDKQDATDDRELALIGYPVRELFSARLYDFDMIIFDRYPRRDLIPPAYFAYMADYVESGGAMLVAAGPDFNTPQSIARTALVSVLPAQPTTEIIERGFRPRISEVGHRHPVTANLEGAGTDDEGPSWGRWFRLINTDVYNGNILMTGPDERPLLVVDTAGKGRVAQLLSDQVWLWARGFEGGGPQAELLRRLAHWLMKEPDLEEEVLRGEVKARTLTINRRTMAETASPVTVTLPSGKTRVITLEETAPGRYTARMPIDEVGLYRLTDGELTALVAVGPLNPREVADMRATATLLEPIAEQTGGGIYWVGSNDGAHDVPAVRFISKEGVANGKSWLGIQRSGAYIVTAVEETPLMMPSLALALILLTLLFAWRQESQ